MRWAGIWAECSPGLATSQLAREDTDLRNERRHKWRAWPRTHHRSHIMSCLLCSSGCASAMAPGPRDEFLFFCFERRLGHECWEFGSGRHEHLEGLNQA